MHLPFQATSDLFCLLSASYHHLINIHGLTVLQTAIEVQSRTSFTALFQSVANSVKIYQDKCDNLTLSGQRKQSVGIFRRNV